MMTRNSIIVEGREKDQIHSDNGQDDGLMNVVPSLTTSSSSSLNGKDIQQYASGVYNNRPSPIRYTSHLGMPKHQSPNNIVNNSNDIGDVKEEVANPLKRRYCDNDDMLFEVQEKQLQTQKYLTIVPYEITYHDSGQLLTCVRGNKLPMLVNKLVGEVNDYLKTNLDEDEEEKVVDVYAIQTMFLNAIMRIDLFNNEVDVYESVKNKVFKDLNMVMSPPDYYPFNYPTFYGKETDDESIVNYNKLMESDEMVDLRKSYQTKYTKAWTKEERKKFQEGLKLFGYGHDSNKKIAEHMGSSIHPNQVAHEKQKLQQRHQKKRKRAKK